MLNREVGASLASFAVPGLLSRASQIATVVEDKRQNYCLIVEFQDVLYSKQTKPKETGDPLCLRNPHTK